MAITPTGLETKRFPEIIEELRQEILTTSGNPRLDLSDTSLLGIINAVFANAIAEQQELLQALWGNLEIDSAEGLALDRLVAYIGLRRLSAVKSRGRLLFTGNINTTVPLNTEVRDSSGRPVVTLAAIVLDLTSCNRTSVRPIVQNNTVYSININGTPHTYISDSSATLTEILNGLVASIGTPTGVMVSNVDNNSLLIQSSTNSNSVSVAVGGNFTVLSSSKFVDAEAVNVGDLRFEPNTLVRLTIPRIGLSVTNPISWLIGRFQETDAELRLRHRQSTSITGRATIDAITAALQQIDGVSKVFVNENPKDFEVGGLPPHSIECTVRGGADLDIANTIWLNKAGGIETFGNTTQQVLDISGTTRDVNFSRPTARYIHLKITYSTFDEETFPVDGETVMRNAALSFGDTLDLGADVIPPRFLGPIYQAVSGIGNMAVEAAVTDTPSETPTSYSTNIIPIGQQEEPLFDLDRIVVVEV